MCISDWSSDVCSSDLAAPATSLDIFNAAVEGLTQEKVNAIAKAMFTGQGPIVSLLSSSPIEGGNGTLRAAYDSSVRLAVAPPKAQQAKSWAYSDFGKAGTVVSVGKPDLLGATTYTFANGVKLTVKQVDFNKN